MLSRSVEFDTTVKYSHKIVTKAEVYSAGTLQRTLEITEGSITIDDAPIRRRANITLTDPTGDLTPTDATSLLSPFGNEIKLYRGIQLSTGPEYIPLGVYGISSVRITESGQSLTMVVQLYDRARKVILARLVNDYVIAAGTNYVTAIQDLITFRYPGATFSFPTGVTNTTPRLYFQENWDIWKQAQKMAVAIGYDLYFDAYGVCTMTPVPSIYNASVWDYSEGPESMILSVDRSLNDEEIYNHFVVTGESTSNSTPYRGEASDTTPTSPTYIYGAFGDRPQFIRSGLVTSNAQAQTMATAELQKSIGQPLSANVQSIVHPAHDVGDVIRIVRDKAKIDSFFVMDKLTIPMIAERGMYFTGRQR